MKKTERTNVMDASDALIIKLAQKRSNSIHCDCSLPFLRAKDNRCNICEKQIRNI